MKKYVKYHLHDDTSNVNGFFDSASNYEDYIKLAKKEGDSAIAFSNHGGMYDWIKKKLSCDKYGIKYIHGIEAYMCRELEFKESFHIGLYGRNLEGVKELNLLISKSFSKDDGHFYKRQRVSMAEIMNTSDNIIITTACIMSILAKLPEDSYTKEFIEWMSKNSDRCFLEVQYHDHELQINYNKYLYNISKKYNIRLIAGTDTHSANKYIAKCRKIVQIAKDSYYGDEDSFDLTWKTYDELVECFKNQDCIPEKDYLEAIENTNVLADMVEDFDLDRSFKYPTLYGEDAINLWKKYIIKKLKHKINVGEVDKNRYLEYKKSINEEFRAMKKQGMESFMLFMSELLDYCVKNDIPWGDCRGSVGGSLIAFITDITDVDPLVWETVFSRFCNETRISLADIDIDFAPEDREKVYNYIISRFGKNNSAYILTLGTVKTRGTIDILAKGLKYKDLNKVKEIKNKFDKIESRYKKIVQEEVNIEELDYEHRNIDFDSHDVYMNRIRNVNASKELDNLMISFEELKNSNQDLFYYFNGIKGTIVSKGYHPAGMIGSPITLMDNLGIYYRGGEESFPVSSCAMKSVDYCNYVKFDILGLKTMGILKDVYKMIGKKWEKSYLINWNDKKVWDDMITNKVGVFQFEGKRKLPSLNLVNL